MLNLTMAPLPGQKEHIPAVIHNGKKTFTVLENNPAVMNRLARTMGLSKKLAFYDVYSLEDPGLRALIPRPVHALLAILPLTPAWEASRVAEDADQPDYKGQGMLEPIVWFKQTIGHACGSIGLLHCLLNGSAREFVRDDSFLDKLETLAVPLNPEDRAFLLYDCEPFEHLHQSVAHLGDTTPPSADEGDKLGQHFVAFVKGHDGHLYELEGSRKGPIDRGALADDEDVFSEKAIANGIGRIMEMEQLAGAKDLRFSVIALAKASK